MITWQERGPNSSEVKTIAGCNKATILKQDLQKYFKWIKSVVNFILKTDNQQPESYQDEMRVLELFEFKEAISYWELLNIWMDINKISGITQVLVRAGILKAIKQQWNNINLRWNHIDSDWNIIDNQWTKIGVLWTIIQWSDEYNSLQDYENIIFIEWENYETYISEISNTKN